MANEHNPILEYYKKLLARRRMWEDIWQDIAAFEMPRRLVNLNVGTEGEDQTQELFDSTAPFSINILAASLQTGLTNQALKWFTLRMADPSLMADEGVRGWLEEVNLRMLAAFSASNFGPESTELYMDIIPFGIGAMFMGEAEDPKPIIAGNSFRGFRFMAQPIGSYVVDENGFGVVDTIIYKVSMSAGAAVDRFGSENVSDDVRTLAQNDPSREIWFLNMVAPKSRWPQAKTSLAFTSQWIEEKTKVKVSEGGFREFPFLVPRWSKTSGEMYGRGPGFIALPDVKTLNKTIELNLKAMAIAIQPPLLAKVNSVIGSIDFESGGVTYVRQMDDIKEFITNANFRAAMVEIEDLRQSIRRVFNIDFLLQLLSRETPQMTATEVTAKMQLIREVVGPAFMRLETEFLQPAIDRGFAIMARAVALPEAPAILGDNFDIQVDYESPIGLAKRGQELTAIDRVLLRAQELGALGKIAVLDKLDGDAILDITAEIAGAPQRIFLSQSDLESVREERRQQQEEQEQIQAAAAASEVARNSAPLAKVIQEAEGGGA